MQVSIGQKTLAKDYWPSCNTLGSKLGFQKEF